MNGQAKDDVILSVWLEGDEQEFSFQPIFTEPATWGVLFADIARAVAEAYTEDGFAEKASIEQIRQAFLAELEHPTV